jgi:hypothetical protein
VLDSLSGLSTLGAIGFDAAINATEWIIAEYCAQLAAQELGTLARLVARAPLDAQGKSGGGVDDSGTISLMAFLGMI